MSSTTPVTPYDLHIGQRVWIEYKFVWKHGRFTHEWQEAFVREITPSPFYGDDSTRVYVEALAGTWTDYVTFDAVQLAQPVAEMEAAL